MNVGSISYISNETQVVEWIMQRFQFITNSPLSRYMFSMAKDWSGQKLHRLTFVAPTERRVCQRIIWEALCECGAITYVNPANVRTGHIKSCGCLKNEALVKSNQARRIHEPIISSARAVWGAVYKDASFETFFRLSQLPCHYCECLPAKTRNIADYTPHTPSDNQIQNGTFTYNGLDRIDSSKGHTDDNVVSCCWDCNRAKGNKTLEEFLAHIERMYQGTRHLR